MIPKSVSLSTLILALGAVLIWPVWGVAGEPERIGNGLECMIWADEKTGVHIEGKDCRNFTDLSCHQRMREAMKAMDKHTPISWETNTGQLMMTPSSTLTTPKIYQPIYLQWYVVMRDCVDRY